MGKSIYVGGFYGHTDGRSIPCQTSISLNGGAMSETLSLSYMGKNRITLPFRPIERLGRSVLSKIPRNGICPTIEEETTIDGFYANGGVMLRPGKITIWFRSNGQIDMISLSCENNGQLSVPYIPITRLAKSQRSGLI